MMIVHYDKQKVGTIIYLKNEMMWHLKKTMNNIM